MEKQYRGGTHRKDEINGYKSPPSAAVIFCVLLLVMLLLRRRLCDNKQNH